MTLILLIYLLVYQSSVHTLCMYVCLCLLLCSVFITGSSIQQTVSPSVLTHIIGCALSCKELNRANTITHCISNDRTPERATNTGTERGLRGPNKPHSKGIRTQTGPQLETPPYNLFVVQEQSTFFTRKTTKHKPGTNYASLKT